MNLYGVVICTNIMNNSNNSSYNNLITFNNNMIRVRIKIFNKNKYKSHNKINI